MKYLNGWIASSSACVDARALLDSLCFHRRQQSVTRLSQEHDDHALTDPDLVALFVALRIAWQSFAAFTHEFHPTGGRGNVLSVHLESDLYIVGHQGYVCYIPRCRISRFETICTASRPSTRERLF